MLVRSIQTTGASIYPGWAMGGELGWASSVVGDGVTNLGRWCFSKPGV